MKIGIFLALAVLGVAFYFGTNIKAASFFAPPFLMFILATSLLAYSLRDYYVSRRAWWPHVAGRMVSAKLVKTMIGNRFEVEYTYSVKDIRHTSTSFDFSQKLASSAQLRRHQELGFDGDLEALSGRLVRVYYNPSRPYEASLCNKYSDHKLITTIPSIVVIIFSLINLTYLFHKIWTGYFSFLI